MEDQNIQKKEEINSIDKKNIKKSKKKKKSNVKGLKELLETFTNIKNSSKNKIKEKINRNKINKEEQQSAKEVKDEKEIENLDMNKIQDDKNININNEFSINLSFNSKVGDKILDKKIKSSTYGITDDSQKHENQNYIAKFNGPKEDNLLNNSKEKKDFIYSLIYKYYNKCEEYLKKTNENTIDLNISANFLQKNLISSSEFKINYGKLFRKKNIIINNMNKEKQIVANNRLYNNINVNNFIKDDYKYNYDINSYFNTIYLSNNLNINLFCNNISLKANEYENKYNNSEKNININKSLENFKEDNSENSNCFVLNSLPLNINETKEITKAKEELSKIIENINSNNNITNFYPDNTYFPSNDYFYNNSYENFINNTSFYENYTKGKENSIYGTGKKIFVRRPNDWVCEKCYNLNFAFRVYCNRCSAPKEI